MQPSLRGDGPPSFRSPADDIEAALESGAFAGYPGPVALLTPWGVEHANDAGAGLADALGGRLQDLVAAAPFGKPVLVETPAGVVELVRLAVPGRADADLLVGRDVTLDHKLRHALIDSRERLRDLVTAGCDLAWETDVEGRFVFVSDPAVLGYAASDLAGRPAAGLMAAAEGTAGAAVFATRAPVARVDLWLQRADGTPACFLATALPIVDAAGAWRGARGACRDITAERQRDHALAQALHRERTVNYINQAMRDELEPTRMLAAAATATMQAVPLAGCAIACMTPHGAERITACGAVPDTARTVGKADGVTRLSAPGRTGLRFETRHHGRINGRVEAWRESGREDGREAGRDWEDDQLALLRTVARQLGIAIQQYMHHREMVRLSSTDALTGLMNRARFLALLTERLAAGETGCLAYVDLDNFKKANDRLGHQHGDTVLQRVGRILDQARHDDDLVGRLGGDEFVMWMAGVDDTAALARAEGLRLASGALIPLSGSPDAPLGYSIGLAVHPEGAPETVAGLTARADAAMYAAKADGKSTFRFAPPFEPAPAEGRGR